MNVSELFERDGRAERAARPASGLMVSKLRRPLLRPGIVDRPLLIERLARGDYDVHVLHNRECLSAPSVLADHVPAGSRPVVAGRTGPLPRLARLRAEGRILEIGPRDLSLTVEEASSLLHDAGVMLGDDEAAGLHRRTEGWPAGQYIAALAIKAGSQNGETALTFTGGDVFMHDYLRSELLDRLPDAYVSFLTRTSALERMSGPLCDAVLDERGSAGMLAELAR